MQWQCFLNSLRSFFCKKSCQNAPAKSWREIEYFDEAWKKRIAHMAELITPNTHVLDLGCGKQWLREFLPANCGYIPVDYIQRSPDTVVCDFNNDSFPNIHADVAFISGCLEYIHDYENFIKNVTKNCDSVIISYCSLEKHPHISARRDLSWVNDLSTQNLLDLFFLNNMKLIKDASTENEGVFLFKKS